MGNYIFQHITGFGSSLTPKEEREKMTFGWGEIDVVALGKTIFNYSPDEEAQERIKSALCGLTPRFSRCQHDLLRLEYGKEKKPLAEIALSTDTLDDSDAEDNTEKLTKALDMIVEWLRTH